MQINFKYNKQIKFLIICLPDNQLLMLEYILSGALIMHALFIQARFNKKWCNTVFIFLYHEPWDSLPGACDDICVAVEIYVLWICLSIALSQYIAYIKAVWWMPCSSFFKSVNGSVSDNNLILFI